MLFSLCTAESNWSAFSIPYCYPNKWVKKEDFILKKNTTLLWCNLVDLFVWAKEWIFVLFKDGLLAHCSQSLFFSGWLTELVGPWIENLASKVNFICQINPAANSIEHGKKHLEKVGFCLPTQCREHVVQTNLHNFVVTRLSWNNEFYFHGGNAPAILVT